MEDQVRARLLIDAAKVFLDGKARPDKSGSGFIRDAKEYREFINNIMNELEDILLIKNRSNVKRY